MQANQPGRQSMYTDELAQAICDKIAVCTDSLKDILASNPEWPCSETIYTWIYKNKQFSEMYARAKRAQAQRMVEELDQIANDKLYYEDDKGNKRVDSGYSQSQRLIADTRKWIACKLIPKVYGDKQQIEQTVTVKHEDALKELE